MIVNAKPFQTKGFGGLLEDILGDANAQKIQDALKTTATTAITNTAGNLVQKNPDATSAFQNFFTTTGNSTLAQAWNNYKTPIIIVSALLAVGVTIGVYNTFANKKKA